MTEVGKALWRSSAPASQIEHGCLDPVAQDHVQTAFQYLQGERLHNLSGQPVPGLSHPRSKEVLPDVQRNLPVPQFVPTASCTVAKHHWKDLGSVLFALSCQVFIHIYKIPPSLLLPRVKNTDSLSLSPFERCSNPLIILVALHWTLSSMSISFLDWGAKNWTQYSKCCLSNAE